MRRAKATEAASESWSREDRGAAGLADGCRVAVICPLLAVAGVS